MERIYFVRNNDLRKVNNILQNGGSIKMIHAVPQVLSSSPSKISTSSPAYSSWNRQDDSEDGAEVFEGDVYAYIVVKMP